VAGKGGGESGVTKRIVTPLASRAKGVGFVGGHVHQTADAVSKTVVPRKRHRGFESPVRFRKPRTACRDPARQAGFSRLWGEVGGNSGAKPTTTSTMLTSKLTPLQPQLSIRPALGVPGESALAIQGGRLRRIASHSYAAPHMRW